ncbi:MerR family transcriptional regulator [Candidatus Babeliales bacterium]|nr:MerR family transcriptional regulator [Candidatus Babeliales bacterium]
MQHQKMSMKKRQFRIGDLARELSVKKYVIRFWEKEFELKSDRSDGGQRFYTEEDLDLFLQIKNLLYLEGFTIAGAKKQLMSDVKVATPASAAPREVAAVQLQADEVMAAHREEEPVEEKTILAATVELEPCTEERAAFFSALQAFKEELLAFKDALER